MGQKSGPVKEPAEQVVKGIRRVPGGRRSLLQPTPRGRWKAGSARGGRHQEEEFAAGTCICRDGSLVRQPPGAPAQTDPEPPGDSRVDEGQGSRDKQHRQACKVFANPDKFRGRE